MSKAQKNNITVEQAAEFVGALISIADTNEARNNPRIAQSLSTIENLFSEWYGDDNLAVDLGEYIGDVEDCANGEPHPTIGKTRNAVIDFFDGTLGYRNSRFAEKFGPTKTNDRW